MCMAISSNHGLVHHTAIIGGMNAERFNDFLHDARLNLNPDDQVIFIYDGAPAHRNPQNPGPNTELKKLPPYSPFLNIVEQAVSCLKAAIKADISRLHIQARMDDRDEARDRGLALGNFRTQLLLQALQRSIGTITAAKCARWHKSMQTYLPRCINGEEIEG